MERYLALVGEAPPGRVDEIPPHLFPQWCAAGLSAAIGQLPFSALTVRNAGCSLRPRAPLPFADRYEVAIRLEDANVGPRWARCRYAIATGPLDEPDLLEAAVTLMFPVGRARPGPPTAGEPVAPTKPAAPPREPPPGSELVRWTIGPAAGLRFACLTGDVNPAHWSRWFARLVGFPGIVAHGFSSLAQVCERLRARGLWPTPGGDPRARPSLDARFSRPLAVPATVALHVADAELWLVDPAGGRPYLHARLGSHPAPPGLA